MYIFSRTQPEINNTCKIEIHNISLKTSCDETILLLTVVLKDISSFVFLLKFMEMTVSIQIYHNHDEKKVHRNRILYICPTRLVHLSTG